MFIKSCLAGGLHELTVYIYLVYCACIYYGPRFLGCSWFTMSMSMSPSPPSKEDVALQAIHFQKPEALH